MALINLPRFTDADLDDEKQRRRIMSYLYKLDEQLRYVLTHLDSENFTKEMQQYLDGRVSMEQYDEVTGNLTRLSTSVSQNASEISLVAEKTGVNSMGQTEESLRSQILQTPEMIQSAVSAVKLGGTNLLKKTKDLTAGSTMDDWEYKTGYASRYTTTGIDADFARAKLEQASGGSQSWIYVYSPLVPLGNDWQGREVTFSAWIDSPSWTSVSRGAWATLCLNYTSDRQKHFYADRRITNDAAATWASGVTYNNTLVNDKWRRFSVTWKLEQANFTGSGTFANMTKMFISLYLRQYGDVRFYAPKLEWGNKATQWDYSPEDADAEITATRSMITQTASEIRTEVSQIQVGGTNLLKNSGTAVSNSTYNIAKYDLTESIPAGEQVTLRLWGTLGTGKTGFAAYNSGGYVGLADPLTDNSDGTFSKTFNWRIESGSSTASNTQLYIYVKPNSVTGVTSTITKIKLERGNKATDWSPSPADADTEYASIRSEISQTAGEISAQVTGIKVGSTNLLPYTKNLTVGSTGDYWMNSSESSTYTSTDVRVQGFTLVKIVYTSGTSRWHAFSSPYVPLTMDWYGKQITFSSYIYSADWSSVNSGCSVSLALEESVSTSRKRWGDKTIVNADGTWGAGVVADTSAPVNGKWMRFSVTFTLTETGIPNTSSSPGTFTDMKYMKTIYWLVQNGDIRFYAPKLEWGNKATSWCDSEGELVNTSMKLNDSGIFMNTTGTFQLNAQNPDEDAYINIRDLMTCDKNGGLVAKRGTFDALTKSGANVLTTQDVNLPIIISSTQPANVHRVVWIQPTSGTSSIEYKAYTAGSRDSTVHFGATNPVSRTFSQQGTDTMSGSSFDYTLEFDAYCLTDLPQITSVVFNATATKGGTSRTFDASAAITMTKYQLAHITLVATNKSTNLCSSSGDITVSITASASSLTKLFLQAPSYMRLTVSKHTTGTGTQSCNVQYIN